MGLKAAGADLLFKGGLLNGTRGIAALSAAGTEFGAAGGYERIAMALADWTIPVSGANHGTARNTAVQNWPEPTAVLADMTHFGIYSATSAGDLLWDFAIDGDVDPAQIGADFGIDAGALVLGGSGVVTNEGMRLAFREGLLSGTRAISIHTAEPDATGSNQEGASVTVTAAQFDLTSNTANTLRRARNNVRVRPAASTTDLDDTTWAALRAGTASNAQVLMKAAYTNNPDDPASGDALVFNTNMFEIRLTVDAP